MGAWLTKMLRLPQRVLFLLLMLHPAGRWRGHLNVSLDRTWSF